MASPKSRSCFIAVLVLFVVNGCVHESTDGARQTFAFDLWVPLSVFLLGVVAGVAGWFLRKSSARYGWGLLIAGALATILFAPSMLCDRAVVDDVGFSVRTGIWGLTDVHDVKFDNLKQVRIIVEEVTGRRGSKTTNFYLLCEGKDGQSSKVPVNNEVARAAAPHFLKKVADRGIPILDAT